MSIFSVRNLWSISLFPVITHKVEKPILNKGRNMYALVEILGRQYKAEEGKELTVDRLNMEEGSTYEIEKVLAVVDGENAKFGTPYVEGAKVTATVGPEFRGEKIKVYKFRRRKGYRRTQGHRETYTTITVNTIVG